MKPVVLVIAEKNFRDEEYLLPKEVLEKEGLKVITASASLSEATGMLGHKVTPDILLKDVFIDKISALIFIGGGGSKQYFNDEIAINLAKKAQQKGLVHGAICIAPAILANAGVLKNKKATVYPSVVEHIKEQGGIYIEQSVVTDGLLVTANGPDSAKKFGEEIVRLIKANS